MIKITFNVEKQAIEVSSEPIGQLTNSNKSDYYVYEWFIKESGEIFYVGKGRGNRYKEYHERAYEAEKIKKLYDTDVKFVGSNLTEQEAIELESKEMIRILNETEDRLTNRIIPYITRRDNGYGRSNDTPLFQYEVAPVLYASEIDQHYFNIKGKAFDEVSIDNLKSVVFIYKNIDNEILEVVYGNNYKKYYDETIAILESNSFKTMKSKFSKTVTAWIYSGDDYVTNSHIDQKLALERIGRNIPTYHLIDVWKELTKTYPKHLITTNSTQLVQVQPNHHRVPIDTIKNLTNWEKGFDDGFKFWEQGDTLRKSGKIMEAIILFDKARYNGYNAPVLYDSYAMAYRKLKDYANEIDILNEGIQRNKHNPQIIIKWEDQVKKASVKLKKTNKRFS